MKFKVFRVINIQKGVNLLKKCNFSLETFECQIKYVDFIEEKFIASFASHN